MLQEICIRPAAMAWVGQCSKNVHFAGVWRDRDRESERERERKCIALVPMSSQASSSMIYREILRKSTQTCLHVSVFVSVLMCAFDGFLIGFTVLSYLSPSSSKSRPQTKDFFCFFCPEASLLLEDIESRIKSSNYRNVGKTLHHTNTHTHKHFIHIFELHGVTCSYYVDHDV